MRPVYPLFFCLVWYGLFTAPTVSLSSRGMGAGGAKGLLKVIDTAEDRKKIDAAFKAYDKDKNGWLDANEFLTFASDVVELIISKHGNEKAAAFFPDEAPATLLKDLTPDARLRCARLLWAALWTLMGAKDGKVQLSDWEAAHWSKLTDDIHNFIERRDTTLKNLLANHKWLIKGSFKEKKEKFASTVHISFEVAHFNKETLKMTGTMTNSMWERQPKGGPFESKKFTLAEIVLESIPPLVCWQTVLDTLMMECTPESTTLTCPGSVSFIALTYYCDNVTWTRM